ncbi:metallophosphoesterase family protein [Arthrobacter sp. HMWF013]|uniref:metallophosphoesterase family protein n=1 Tax=Arthrobacter sp. HMWF013 TaxID=2056849 RepID=UPI000D35D5B0|nr:metallophosphoesterase [Arthrobacter sp. HMWF013]PTT70194.1 hypothetical protein DBR22_01880 [Arthrobacter sp. HMWF013]
MNEMRPLAVVGDVHGDIQWLRDVAVSCARENVRTILQVGDLGLDWPGRNRARLETRLERLLAAEGMTMVTCGGNHDNWDTLSSLPVQPDGLATWRPHIRFLPRGRRATIEGLTVGALGGAFSLDGPPLRTEGKDWWANEEPTPEEALNLVAGGHVDILLTHDVPAGVPMKSEMDLPADVLARANQTREIIQMVVDELKPGHVFCGHWHVQVTHELQHPTGERTRVNVLAHEYNRWGNAVLVRPGPLTLTVESLHVRGR